MILLLVLELAKIAMWRDWFGLLGLLVLLGVEVGCNSVVGYVV